MNDNDSLTVIAKITSIVIGTLSFLLVNNKFVLGKSESMFKSVKKDLEKHEKHMATVELQYAQSYKDDRREMFELFEKAIEKSEKRLKEHITLAIKADKVDTFNQHSRS